MKEIAHLIKELKEQGIALKVVGDNLEVSLFNDDIEEAVFDQIRSRKPEIIDYINSLEVGFNHSPIMRAPVRSSYNLSNAQFRIWIACKFEGASTAYNIPCQVQIQNEINQNTLKRAILCTLERHEILRTIFEEHDTDVVRQRILPITEVDISINYIDLRSPDREADSLIPNSQDRMLEAIERDYLTPFNLEICPLFRVILFQLEKNNFVFYYNMHHIISDGWSTEIFLNDVLTFYEYCQSLPATSETRGLNELTIQYKDYSEWQRSQFTNNSYDKHETYWLNYLSGELPRLDFPGKNSRPPSKTYDGKRLMMHFEPELTSQIKSYAEKKGGSLFIGLLAVWNILCYRYTGQSKILVGTLVNGREHPDLHDQIGFYSNIMVLANRIDDEDNFDSFFQKVKETTLESYQYQSFPFDHLVNVLNVERDSSRSAIFDCMLTMDNVEEKRSVNFNLDVNALIDGGYIATKYDIDVNFQEKGEYLSFQVVFNTDLYSKEMVTNLMNNYRRLLMNLLKTPNERVNKIEFLSTMEKSIQLDTFNEELVKLQSDKGIIQLFEEQVQKSSENSAIIFSSRDERGLYQDRVLTYSMLNDRVNRFAKYLKTHQVNDGDFVGILLERTEWLVISMLSILKIGCAYVAIDLEFPEKRIDFIKNDANLKLVIDEQILLAFTTSRDIDDCTMPTIDENFEKLAYLIYTSGTTGNPKGVMIQRNSMLNYVLVFQKQFALNEHDKVIQQSSASFDTHIEEIFPILLSGGTILMGENGKGDLDELKYQIKEKGATILSTTPWVLRELNRKDGIVGNLRLIISGGDVFKASFVSNFLGKVSVYDTYGPSETTVCATFMKIESDHHDKVIGRPFKNTTIYILGESSELLPIGVTGEIYIGGNGLAKGYLNEPQLTSERFVVNPFAEGEKLYKSGDLGRWHTNGNLEFIGRKDDQVKIRGYRVEKEEVSNSLMGHPDVKEAVVEVVENSFGENELKVYFSLVESINSDPLSNNEKRNGSIEIELRSFLLETMPTYMIPTHFIRLQKIPLTASGKFDRKQLAQSERVESELFELDFIEPRDAIEEKLKEIFQSILEMEKIDVRMNFFAIGGNSLSAIRLISKIRAEFGISIDITTLFNENSIEYIGNLVKLIETELGDFESESFKV